MSAYLRPSCSTKHFPSTHDLSAPPPSQIIYHLAPIFALFHADFITANLDFITAKFMEKTDIYDEKFGAAGKSFDFLNLAVIKF